MNRMFTLDTIITDLNVKERNICKVLFSMNIHKVATPEMMLEEARSYALFFRENKGKFSAYIALHLLSTNRRLYYSHSDNPFFDDKMEHVEEEAVAFAESLGAMLDEIDFAKLSDSEQDRWIDEQEIFSKKTISPATSEVLSESQPAAQSQQAEQTAQQPTTQVQPETPPVMPTSHVEQSAPVQVMPPQEPPIQAAPKLAMPVQSEQLVSPGSTASIFSREEPTTQVEKPPPVLRSSVPVSPAQKTTKVQKSVPPPLPQTTFPHAQTSVHQEIESPAKQSKRGQLPPAGLQQEIMQKAIKDGVAKPPKQTQSKETKPAVAGVRRDREALARLLTSF